MEIPNTHTSLLTDLLPQYRLINSIYEQVIDSLKLNFDSQCHITDFYNTFKDRQAFEKAILNLLLSTDKEKLTLITTNLREEISKSIDLYATHKDFFDKIDTLKVCTGRYNPLHTKIEGQLKDTNKLWQELTQVRNSLESASWNKDQIATQRLTKDEKRLENAYKKEQEKLQTLYQQQKESDKSAFLYTRNVFREIDILNNSFISILENYFPDEKEETTEPESITTNTEIISDPEPQSEIEPDIIFRTNMFNKLLILEQKLIADKYLNPELHWVSVHENGKPDIKRLVTFLVGLLDNRYFLPGRDAKIKIFFESRYHITIGQNFERRRREPLLDDYRVVFYDYPF